MLRRNLDPQHQFSRRDAGRLAVSSLVLLIVIGAILSFDIVPTRVGLQVGQIAPETILAPKPIEFESAIETAAARQAARAAVQPQYDYTPEKAGTIAIQQVTLLKSTIVPIDAAFNADLTPEARRGALATALPRLSDTSRATLQSLTPKQWSTLRDDASLVLDKVERAELRDSDVAGQRATLPVLFDSELSGPERSLGAEVIGPLLLPNSSYSETLTNEARDLAARNVPPVRYPIQQNEVIIDRGHQVTALDLAKMDALGIEAPRLEVARLAGWYLFAALIVGLLLAWVWRFRPEFWHRNNALLLLGLLLVVSALALKLTAGRSILPFFVPLSASGLLVAILLDSTAGTVLMAILALVAGAVNGNSLEIAAYVFLGGFAGILAVRRGDRLAYFVQAALATALVDVVVVSVFGLLGDRDFTGTLQLWAASGAAAGGAAVAAVGSFAVLGNLFGILTIFQLLELANPNQPLLHRLLTEAPGTYHHSLMVGNLAERAAVAIGADALLTRVAAYYHDIGKLANPLAFIENQAGLENIHDQLEPEISAQVLKQHVPDGIDAAYRARLPKSLIAFIPQHHGTALISYFYAKAQEEAAAAFGGPDTPGGALAAAAVDQRPFRHSGPKPQTREAALIMLADGVEASVRSLGSRDEATIRAMVSRIIDERLGDGQFDECDLTIRDLQRTREAFVGQLLGMYHQRIAYPQNKIVELETRRGASGAGGAGN